MRAPLVLLCLLAVACREPSSSPPTRWVVYVAEDAPPAVRIAADDTVAYLDGMGLDAELDATRTGTIRCKGGVGRVVVAGDALTAPSLPDDATDQTFHVDMQACGSGMRVVLAGGGLLGRQYAVYEWLRVLGVRYFHPEQELVPTTPAWPALPYARTQTPAFRDRSVSLHLTHPLELGDAFRDGEEAYFEEARRYIDWQVKNLASLGHEGVGTGALARYGLDRGFPPQTSLRLYGSQQGSVGVIDLDSPVPWQTQIADAIEARMNPASGVRPVRMGVAFDPSEFTEVDDQIVVAQLTFIADYMAEHHPDVRIQATNHGTYGEPTAHYGIRYYDLPRLAPANMNVIVHPLMFYDLFRPAPVYGNTDFNHFYDFIEEERHTREITYFPESAWWLTFDIAVPLYLPITVEARDRDIQGLRHMLGGGLVGHHVFGSGHEWGYWQNEYCSFRMAADVDVRWQDCFRDLTGAMGAAGEETQAVLEAVVASQETFMFDAELLRYIVGTDDETEAAATIGVVFHPLPPSPNEILTWSQGAIDAFQADVEPRLLTIASDFETFAYRLEQVRADVPANAMPFFAEIVDGVEMMGIRARHQAEVYGGLVRLRESQLAGSTALRAMAEAQIAAAVATTERARTVIARREQGYRYHPIARSIAGGPLGGEDDNWTTYAYRYLNRTHHAFYFTRIDGLAAQALAGAQSTYEVDDAIVGPEGEHVVRVLDAALLESALDWGDGDTASMLSTYTHAYAAPGTFDATLTGTLDDAPFSEVIPLARVDLERATGFTGALVAPAGAELIESILPAIVFGAVDGDRLAVGFTARVDGAVTPSQWRALALDTAAEVTTTLATDVYVPIVNRASHTVLTRVEVRALVLTHADTTLALEGSLSTTSVVDAVVLLGNGAFDPPGARAIVAATLGYTVETLPDFVPFEVRYTLP